MTLPSDQTDEFEPAFGWNRCDLDVVNHEVAHALAADALGVDLFEIRMDRPVNYARRGPDPLGYCKTEKLEGEDRWRQLLIDLAPLVLEGKAPISPPSLDDHHGGDLFSAAIICFELEIDEMLFLGYIAFIESLLRTPIARKKGQALGSALLDRGALVGVEVDRIFAEVQAQANGKGKADDFNGR